MKKYVKFAISLLIFFLGSLLQYIPMFIFNLSEDNITIPIKVALITFSNLVSVIILIIMYRKTIVEGFKNLKKNKWKALNDGFNYWFIGLMVMVLSNTLITFMNGGVTSTNEESVQIMLRTSKLAILSVCLIAPVIEELVFRKAFKDVFKNKWVYLFTSGVLFGALHVLSSPINSFVDYLYLIPYCSMGVAFAYTYYKTDNIAAPIIMHVVHNSLNTISTLVLAGVILW